jgi:hypothetical protein|tara:strand:+ start:245 stop:490 length:246 start_codon:yes stop_codon:yes gene_type:complete
MLLYRESDLDSAWHIDCKARTKQGISWLPREDFRDIYERLVEFHINKALKEKVLELDGDVPEWVQIAVRSTLDELELDLDE